MDSAALENCVIEIKRSLARIEEQIKTLFISLGSHEKWADQSHADALIEMNALKKDMAEIHRNFDVRVSRHDEDIQIMQKDMASIKALLEAISQNTQKAKGIAVGLGMAGGAAVSIMTLLIQLWKA